MMSHSNDTPTPSGALTASDFRTSARGGAERYSRQTLFTGIGREGQERIAQARVLIVGCGATGSVLANNLARAGVGHLRIADRDFVEGNNLQRQVLYEEDDALAGLPKAIAAAQRIGRINSLVEVEALPTDVTAENIEEMLEGVDLAMDGTALCSRTSSDNVDVCRSPPPHFCLLRVSTTHIATGFASFRSRFSARPFTRP
jgi:hypothetical protein